MVILKDYFSQSSCEVEINLVLVNESSVKFNIQFRSGKSFPEPEKDEFQKIMWSVNSI